MTLDEWTEHRLELVGQLNGIRIIHMPSCKTEQERKTWEYEKERLEVCLRAWDRDKAQLTSGPTPDFIKLARIVYGLKK